ncbi:C-C motif chemokine 2-like [Colossoma macropomum]|uniref:C-C motif chemokine 2-like n=1 Tax=Colossoma macropomum TaxID=42526 RepID=UPI001864C6C6|nr:C-C motif chemokine 2-like [Colossoma macropomum]
MQLKRFAVFLFAMQWADVTLAGIGPPTECCWKTSNTRISVIHIVSYVHQDLSLCPIKAVRFTTKNGKTICSDPESSWANLAIKMMDTRKSTQASPEDPSFIIEDNPREELTTTPTYTDKDPPAQKQTAVLPLTLTPSLASTHTQNPSESTITTTVTKEAPGITILPWTLRRLKKKSKSGVRKAQRRRD